MLGLFGSLALCAALLVSYGRPISVLAGLGALCLMPGCGLVCWLQTRDRLARVIAIIAASLTWTTLASTILARQQLVTRPVTLGVSVIATALSCGTFLVLGRYTWRTEPAARGSLDRVGRAEQRTWSTGLTWARLVASIGVLVSAILLWALSIVRVGGQNVGDYGLLPLLGPPFLAGLALALVLACWALYRRVLPIATASLVFVLVMLNGTPAILAQTPLANWSYKHFGVVDYIVAGSPLSDAYDVYQQWPGFFASAASLVTLTGVSPLVYSNWAQLVFEALNTVVVFSIARRVAPGRPTAPHLAALLFIVSAWVGQRYYAPQTLAFLLALMFQFLALPLIQPAAIRRLFVRLGTPKRWRARHGSMETELSVPTLDLPREAGLSLGLMGLFAAITVTHQLSPYIVFASVFGLWVVGVLPRPWLVAGLAAVLGLSLTTHLGALGNLPFLTGFSLSSATGAVVENPASPQAFASQITRPIALIIWLTAGICVLSYRRRLFVAVISGVMIFVPFSVILVQSYGGEAIYRVALFSSPWCAVIVAIRMADISVLPRLRWTIVAGWCLVAALVSAQAQAFGQFPVFFGRTSEIVASTYFLDHAPRGAGLVLALPNFPSRLDRFYVDHNPTETVNDVSVTDNGQFRTKNLDKIDMLALAHSVEDQGGGNGFLVISPSMEAYNRYYGLYPDSTLPQLDHKLRASRYWSVWYSRDGVTIFEARP